MIEARQRSLKHQWLYLHSLDSVATIRRLVTFYVHEHNHVLPHSAFRGQTLEEMYFGDLTSRATLPAEQPEAIDSVAVQRRTGKSPGDITA